MSVNMQNIEKLIGHPRFSSSRFYSSTPSGVAIGLAYTEYGGSLIFIEALQSSFKEKKNG